MRCLLLSMRRIRGVRIDKVGNFFARRRRSILIVHRPTIRNAFAVQSSGRITGNTEVSCNRTPEKSGYRQVRLEVADTPVFRAVQSDKPPVLGSFPVCRPHIPNTTQINRTGSIYWFAFHAEAKGISWKTNMLPHGQALWEEERAPIWFNFVALLDSVAAGVTAFLPIALYTSPWDAVRLRVPGDQGNWWHLLVGSPYFLAFPMIWLCLRGLFSRRLSTPTGRRLIWTAVALSICGTISVTVPFLLRLGNHRVAHASGDCLDLCQASESIEIKNRRIRRAQILKRLIDAFYLPTTDPQHRQDCKRRVVGDDGQSGSTP